MGNELMIAAATMIVSAASLTGVLALFWSVKRETNALDRRIRQDRCETVAAVELLRATMSRLESDLAENRRDVEQFPALASASPIVNSMNLSKRTQALRMHRRGEPLERIAAALGIPHRELELLVKVQDVVRYGAGASA